MCDRKATLWGRPPVCRFEGSPPPRHIFLQIKSAILILKEYGGNSDLPAHEVFNSLRSQRHRNRQDGVLPHRVTFLSRTRHRAHLTFFLACNKRKGQKIE